ncbi:MAG: GNAT family N-acetyltransferase [Deltaproteobacteria bacterium]|nr:GNAT family N-acetyltransferase [Deltaproteobacteria bacterium]
MSAPQWTIRAARATEIMRLGEIEREAGTRFAAVPALADVPGVLATPEALAAALAHGWLWVAAATADDAPIGFTYADPLDDALHVEELDVLPAWGRRGIGRALVETVVDAARAAGLAAVTLTTFRDVPWNAPHYVTLGFRVLAPSELGPGLVELVAAEERRGLPARLRVAMRRDVGPAV